MKTRRWLVAGLLFAVFWVLVSGPALTPRSLLASFVVGLAVGLPVAYVFRRLYEEEISVTRTIRAVPYALLYVLVFLKEVLVANVDVAYRVLFPGRGLEPQVVLVPLRVETALGITTIANSITLTPGTVTLDHDPDENALYIHMIDGRDPDAVVEPIRQWEGYALQIFDERLSPSDPPPEITVHPPDRPPEPKTVTEWKDGKDSKRTDWRDGTDDEDERAHGEDGRRTDWRDDKDDEEYDEDDRAGGENDRRGEQNG